MYKSVLTKAGRSNQEDEEYDPQQHTTNELFPHSGIPSSFLLPPVASVLALPCPAAAYIGPPRGTTEATTLTSFHRHAQANTEPRIVTALLSHRRACPRFNSAGLKQSRDYAPVVPDPITKQVAVRRVREAKTDTAQNSRTQHSGKPCSSGGSSNEYERGRGRSP
ncbi:hypothetical protein GWK47_015045 [Chionoecetes opilio]|uniref:Uncharacterized protein n=1 Tax=Chionoecetes opilio TaxID=41210 RepID=A0A8J4XVN3_CHIOP|nr:hypothetical protein GWK47_015045 [Chionoecetes opilio]